MTKRPDIVVVILDSLRASNVSAYGYELETTPFLDSFAADNILFRRAISPATWTVPSHASMLTGLYVSQHRVESLEADRSFNADIVTLPAALGAQGYRVAAFSQNMLFSSSNHLDAGFETFTEVDDVFSTTTLRGLARLSEASTSAVRLPARYLRKMIAPRLVFDRAYDWITAESGETPSFLFVNVLAPHFPWTVPPRELLRGERVNPKYLARSEFVTLKRQWDFNAGLREVTDEHVRVWRSLYDAAVRQADREVRRFVERLRRARTWDNTIVVLTSDHGEMLGEGGIVGHVLTLRDKLIQVPMIVRHPDHRGGAVVEGVVQTLDLYPSVLDWAGVPGDSVPPAQLQRPPLSRAIENASDPTGYAFAEEDYTDSYKLIDKLLSVNPGMDPHLYPPAQTCVRSATHKYVWYADRPPALFDLVADPGEEHDRLGDGGDGNDEAIASPLRDALDAWRTNLEIFPPVSSDDEREMDEDTMKRLRALGYVP